MELNLQLQVLQLIMLEVVEVLQMIQHLHQEVVDKVVVEQVEKL